jgi:AcrR family transcriptional regulator
MRAMGRRPGSSLTRQDLVDAAVEIVDRDGAEALALRPVAEALGIRSSSLYHHVDGLEALRHATAVAGWTRLVDAFPAPGSDPPPTLRALAHAYRDFVREHPGLYRLMVGVTFEPTDPALLALTQRTAGVIAALGLPPAQTLHAIRGLRSAIHGFVDLESAGQFRLAVPADASFDWLLDVFVAGLEQVAGESSRPPRGRPR